MRGDSDFLLSRMKQIIAAVTRVSGWDSFVRFDLGMREFNWWYDEDRWDSG